MWEADAPPTPRPHWRVLSEQAGLDERELRAACRRRYYERGETIFHEGDPAGALHLLEMGHVAVRVTTLAGDMSIIDVLHAGDTFGEQLLIDGGGERSASVTAIGKVETLTLDQVRTEALHNLPGVDQFLLMVVGSRLHETTRQLLEARYVPADERVLRCVDRLADEFSATDGGVIPLTQADIASMAGITRSTANRMLHNAEDDGLVEIGRGKIRVLDPEALHRRASRI
ncbi:MAG: Crp/Fnr family transcriptional regulator [Acidimicrobiia bacterium]|nr:Crp/Fnr family transcriptional regulator [Acidimicrobiia bacterium]